jgi:hypothetical protein
MCQGSPGYPGFDLHAHLTSLLDENLHLTSLLNENLYATHALLGLQSMHHRKLSEGDHPETIILADSYPKDSLVFSLM